jgi:murein DD-endopeptidase MepM/ murein hydrolase activator NlpD
LQQAPWAPPPGVVIFDPRRDITPMIFTRQRLLPLQRTAVVVGLCTIAAALTAARSWSGSAPEPVPADAAVTDSAEAANGPAGADVPEDAYVLEGAYVPAVAGDPATVDAAAVADVAFSFPVAGHTLRSVVSHFGDPRDGGRRPHLGIDIAAPVGTPVLAPVAGTVERVGEYPAGGLVVWLRDDSGRLLYYFAHLDTILVRRGQRLRAGEPLGTVGQTGNAIGTRPHLHFAVHEGRNILDPWSVLAAAGRGTAGSADADVGGPVLRTRLAGAALRTAPGGGRTVAVLPRHQHVVVLDTVAGSVRVRYRNHEGYVAAWLLEE